MFSAPAVATIFNHDCLAGVDANSDPQRQFGIGLRFLVELRLQINGSPDGLARRLKDGKCLIAPDLDDLAAASFDPILHDVGELGR
jgi:hypothetical protein